MWEGQDPSKRSSSLILSPWPTRNCTLNWFWVAYYRQLISHRCNHHTLDGITRTCTVIIIQAIEDTLRKIARRWNERSKTSSKKGELTFKDEDIPDMNRNPFSNHGGPRVNAIESSEEMQVKRSVRDVCMPMKLVHEVLVKIGRLEGHQRKKKRWKIKNNASVSTMGAPWIILSKSVQTSSSWYRKWWMRENWNSVGRWKNRMWAFC